MNEKLAHLQNLLDQHQAALREKLLRRTELHGEASSSATSIQTLRSPKVSSAAEYPKANETAAFNKDESVEDNLFHFDSTKRRASEVDRKTQSVVLEDDDDDLFTFETHLQRHDPENG